MREFEPEEGFEKTSELEDKKALLHKILQRNDPQTEIVRQIHGVGEFLENITEAVKPGIAVLLIVAGQSGAGKSTITRQIIHILKEVFPESIREHDVYDDQRNEWVQMSGVNWKQPSKPEDLSASSFLLANEAFRDLENGIRSGKKVLGFFEAPVVTGARVDLGYSAAKWIVNTAASRGKMKVFAMVSVPTDEVCKLSDEDRENAWKMTPEQYVKWSVERGIFREEVIVDLDSLDKFRKSMGTKEWDVVVRKIIQKVVYNYQLDKINKGEWDLPYYAIEQIESDESIRSTLCGLYFTDLFGNDLHIPIERLLVFLNQRADKVYVPKREETQEPKISSLVLDHVAEPADGVEKPFLKT